MQQQEHAARLEDVIDLSRESATPEPQSTGNNRLERLSAELQRVKASWRAASRRLSQSSAASTPVPQRKRSRPSAAPVSAAADSITRYLSSPGLQKQQPAHGTAAAAATVQQATSTPQHKQQRLKPSVHRAAAATDHSADQQQRSRYMAELADDEDEQLHGQQLHSDSSIGRTNDEYDSVDDFLDDRSNEELDAEAQKQIKQERRKKKKASTSSRKRLRRNSLQSPDECGHSSSKGATDAPNEIGNDRNCLQDSLEDELELPQPPLLQQQEETVAAADRNAAAERDEAPGDCSSSDDAPDEQLDDYGMTEVRNLWMPQDLQMHFRQYLQYLVRCKISEAAGVDFKAVVMTQHPTESQYIMRLSAEHIEGLLLQWRSQVTASTWVSALPTLAKALLCLPELSVYELDYKILDDLRRCALCYRKCTGWRLLTLQGVPVKASGYLHDHAAGGITAPRRGERANTAARKGDFGDEQFGGSTDDTGSSTTDEDEASWSLEDWRALKRFERYGTQAARTARRLHRNGKVNADWAFDASRWKMPPVLARDPATAAAAGSDGGDDDDLETSGMQQSEDEAAAAEDDAVRQQQHSSSRVRRSAAAAAPATGSSKRGTKGGGSSSSRRKKRSAAGTHRRSAEHEADSEDFIVADEEVHSEYNTDQEPSSTSRQSSGSDTSDSNSNCSEASEEQQSAGAPLPFVSARKAMPAAAAAAATADDYADARGGRYSTRSSTSGKPHTFGTVTIAAKAALATLSAIHGVRKLDFEGEAAAGKAQAAEQAVGMAATAAAAAGSAAGVYPMDAAAAEAVNAVSSTEDEEDGMLLAQCEKQISRHVQQQDQPLDEVHQLHQQPEQLQAEQLQAEHCCKHQRQKKQQVKLTEEQQLMSSETLSLQQHQEEEDPQPNKQQQQQPDQLLVQQGSKHRLRQKKQRIESDDEQQVASKPVSLQQSSSASETDDRPLSQWQQQLHGLPRGQQVQLQVKGWQVVDAFADSLPAEVGVDASAQHMSAAVLRRRRRALRLEEATQAPGNDTQPAQQQQPENKQPVLLTPGPQQQQPDVVEQQPVPQPREAADVIVLEDSSPSDVAAAVTPGRIGKRVKRRQVASDNDEQQQQQQQPDNNQPVVPPPLQPQQQQQQRQLEVLDQHPELQHPVQQVADAIIVSEDSSASDVAAAVAQRARRKAKRRQVVSDDDEQQPQQLHSPPTGAVKHQVQCTPDTMQHQYQQQQQRDPGRGQSQCSPGKQLLSHKNGYRRRGFLVGGGTCLARCRAHHLLQHWHPKVSALLLDRYNRLRAASQASTEDELQEKAVTQVLKQLYKPALKGLQHMATLFATYKPTKQNEGLTESEQGRQLLQLLEEASDALQV